MGTSTSFGEVAAKLNRASKNVKEARKASFRTAESRMLPRFRDQARRAAGGDRILSHHRSKSPLDADFKQRDTADSSFLFINGTGPWGIRDNSYGGGRTDPHQIRPRRSAYLKFMGNAGRMVYVKVVSHPGSSRGIFWRTAADDCWKFVQKRIPEDTIRAIEAALGGSGYRR